MACLFPDINLTTTATPSYQNSIVLPDSPVSTRVHSVIRERKKYFFVL